MTELPIGVAAVLNTTEVTARGNEVSNVLHYTHARFMQASCVFASVWKIGVELIG